MFQVKTLAPILICSMKIFIQIVAQKQQQEGGNQRGAEEAVENRNYLAKRMTEEIAQVTRILEDASAAKEHQDSAYNMKAAFAGGSGGSQVILLGGEIRKTRRRHSMGYDYSKKG